MHKRLVPHCRVLVLLCSKQRNEMTCRMFYSSVGLCLSSNYHMIDRVRGIYFNQSKVMGLKSFAFDWFVKSIGLLNWLIIFRGGVYLLLFHSDWVGFWSKLNSNLLFKLDFYLHSLVWLGLTWLGLAWLGLDWIGLDWGLNLDIHLRL